MTKTEIRFGGRPMQEGRDAKQRAQNGSTNGWDIASTSRTQQARRVERLVTGIRVLKLGPSASAPLAAN